MSTVLGLRARAPRIKAWLFSLTMFFAALVPNENSFASATISSSGCSTVVASNSGVSINRFGNECIIKFTDGTNSWTPPAAVSSVRLLLVGGGGAGGGGIGGGGGAGEFYSVSSYPVTAGTPISISVGSGGSANSFSSGSAGGNSQFGSLYAYGGGGGGTNESNGPTASQGINSYRFGSGGGGGYPNTWTAGSAPTLLGVESNSFRTIVANGETFRNNGGTGSSGSGPSATGGGGGGAGGAGGNGDITAQSGGAGGAGRTSDITGANLFYAGGGGGGVNGNNGDTCPCTSNGTPGAGGSNVGGKGGDGGSGISNRGGVTPTNGFAGVANTGSGGGGASNMQFGGNGSAGIVIVRYTPDVAAPIFSSGPSFNFAENTSISTAAATLTVSESSTLTLNSGSDNASFTFAAIDTLTARLRFINSPNFESAADAGADNIYNLSIHADDGWGNSSDQSITITITNVNEAPTITINTSLETQAISLSEGTSSVITYTALDVDANSTIAWSISGADAGDFTINSTSGVLEFASTPDYEVATDSDLNNIYIVIVSVSDGALVDTQTLTVTITNLNESGSISAPSITGTAYKGVGITLTVNTNSPGKVRFFVGGKRIANCLARTTTGNYPLFTATCSWKPSNFGSQSVTAQLTPSNNSFTSAESAKASIWVFKKSGTRS